MRNRYDPMIVEQSRGGTFSSRFEPTHLAAAELRRDLRRYLGAKGTEAALADDMELVVAELISNAVEQCPAEPVEVALTLEQTCIRLTVTNHRPSGSLDDLLSDATEPKPLADRGRGLAIVHALVDGMWLHGDEESTSVSCVRKRGC